jgi:hypothetical protein
MLDRRSRVLNVNTYDYSEGVCEKDVGIQDPQMEEIS